MADTSFSVPADKQARFTTAYMPSHDDGALGVLDPPVGGWWSERPAIANAAGMLVSTLDDMWAFVSLLLAGGRHEGQALLSPGAVGAMTRDHLTADQRRLGPALSRRARRLGVLHGGTGPRRG